MTMPISKHPRKKIAWSKVLKAKNKRKARRKYLDSPKRDKRNIVLDINTTYQNEPDNHIR